MMKSSRETSGRARRQTDRRQTDCWTAFQRTSTPQRLDPVGPGCLEPPPQADTEPLPGTPRGWVGVSADGEALPGSTGDVITGQTGPGGK